MPYVIRATDQKPVAVATLDGVPCGCGKPHLGGTEHADECPVGVALANHWPFEGTITLPDGTVIEVEPTTWVRLVMDVRARSRADGRDLLTMEANQGDTEAQRRILDAWNAQEAKR